MVASAFQLAHFSPPPNPIQPMLLAATTRLGRSAARFRSTPTSSSLAPSSLTFSSEPERAARLADLPVTYGDIARAQLALKKHLPPTPCPHSHFLSELTGMNVYLKLELNQFTGSFKERGARNALITMEEGVEGVIAASAGNHALALSYHGAQMGVPVTVVMPTVAPLAKVDKCRKFGANIIIKGGNIGESKEYADEIAAAEGLKYINGYDDPPIVAGAGTIGIEIMDQGEKNEAQSDELKSNGTYIYIHGSLRSSPLLSSPQSPISTTNTLARSRPPHHSSRG